MVRYAYCMSEQIAVRLSDDMTRELDKVVDSGAFSTRAEAVRVAIGQLLERLCRERIGEAIVAGYQRLPQTDDEVAAAEAAAVQSINEEPW